MEDLEKEKIVGIKERVMAFLCYFGLLIIIPVIYYRCSTRTSFLKSHLNISIKLYFVSMILGKVFQLLMLMSEGVFILLPILVLVQICLIIYGVVSALLGKENRLPLIKKFEIVK